MATDDAHLIPNQLNNNSNETNVDSSETDVIANKPEKMKVSAVLAEEIETLKCILEYDISLQPAPHNDSLLLNIPISCEIDYLNANPVQESPTGVLLSFFITRTAYYIIN